MTDGLISHLVEGDIPVGGYLEQDIHLGGDILHKRSGVQEEAARMSNNNPVNTGI